MVTLSRYATVNGNENMQKAQEWAKKAAQYVDGKFGLSNVRVGMEVYGSVGRIYWISELESLETLARGAQESLADSGYMQMLMQATGLFVAGSVKDTVILGI
jgi:hypothetical protein